ncbi:hypothetical protein [Pseudomonas yamanorum]
MRAYLLTLTAVAGGFSYSELAQSENLPFGECRTGYWSSSRNLDDRRDVTKGTCLINWRSDLAEQTRLVLGARIGIDDSAKADDYSGRLREGYIETGTGEWTWRVGRQIIAWGRSDRVNPTDNLSPRDLTLLVPEDEDQRMGINAVQIRRTLDDNLTVTAVLADFEANRMPTGTLPRSLLKRGQPDAIESALKLDRAGDSLDWSISWFDGYERAPRYQAVLSAAPLFVSAYERKRAVGADFAWAAQAWTLRGEMAHERLELDCSGCRTVQRKVSRIVLGADRNIGESANFNVQIFGVQRDYQAPGDGEIRRLIDQGTDRLNSEFGARDWGVTTRVSDMFFNERLKLEMSAVVDLSDSSYVVRPRANYSLTDSLKLMTGLDYFHGAQQSYFGVRKKNSLSFVELSLIF